jgi:hypothetical protein
LRVKTGGILPYFEDLKRRVKTGGILPYFEDLKRGTNKEIEPIGIFEIAS